MSRLIGSTFTFFFLSVVIVFGSKVESEQLGNYPSPLNEQQPTYKKLGLELGLAGEEIDLFRLHSASLFLVSTSFDSSLLLSVLIQRLCLGNIDNE